MSEVHDLTMDALTLLREQNETAEGLMSQVFAEVTPEQATWKLPGSTANAIAPTFLHIYHAEDAVIHRLSGQPTIFETGGWQQKLGFDPNAQWSEIARPDIATYRAFAAAVRAATREYLASVDPNTLEQEVQTPRGPRTLAARLTMILINHKITHAGEIAALLGCQGVKGFPF